MSQSQTFRFVMSSQPDLQAGLNGVDEEVTITFRWGGWDEGEVKEYFEGALGEFVDGKARMVEEAQG